MAREFYDIVFRAGEYTDRDGKKKYRNQRGGKLVIEDDGRMWGVIEQFGLEVQFGVFRQQDKDSRDGNSGGGASRRDDDRRDNDRRGDRGSGRGTPRASDGGGGGGRRNDLDDDIPF